jgi:hypothetical protein
MKNLLLLFLLFIGSLFFAACKKENSFIKVMIIDNDSQVVENVKVELCKIKPPLFFGGKHKRIQTIERRTNEKGFCGFIIENFDPEDYNYDILVNNPQEDFGGYTYSVQSRRLEPKHINDTLTIRIYNIPFPDKIPQ